MIASRFLAAWMVAMALAASDHAPVDRPFLHGLFAEHMVLPRARPCPVWGWCAPGATVTVAVAGASASAVAGADGAWRAELPALPPGGPHELVVSGPRRQVVKDVLVGDVWLCAGQSNMEMGIRGVTEWWHEVKPEACPDAVRLALVPRTAAFAPAATLPLEWRPSGAGAADERLNAGGFSAIALVFAREVQRASGVPVGVVQCAWGATAISSWSSPEALARQGVLAGAAHEAWAARLDEAWARLDPGHQDSCAWPSAPDAAGWEPVGLPAAWPQRDGRPFNGVAWFRAEVEVPAAWRGRELELDLGRIQGSDAAWCDGRLIGVGGNDGQGRQWPRQYRIPAEAGTDGRLLVVLRVLGDGLQARAGEPALRCAGAPPQPITAWRCRLGAPRAQVKGAPPDARDLPAGAYQAMVRPLAGFPFTGALWYQGEGNAGQRTYRRALTDMIADWRGMFAADMPFYIVQLAGFGPLAAAPGDSGWAVVREAQAQVAAEVPGCGLAVAVDRGAIFNIHPPDKQDVARRLARLALARVHGQRLEDQGPAFLGAEREGSALRLRFAHAAGLRTLGGGPTGFAVAGADRRFTWAQARIEGETVVVADPAVAEPVAVRYGWADHPLCNLYNGDGLPAVPFRSDSW